MQKFIILESWEGDYNIAINISEISHIIPVWHEEENFEDCFYTSKIHMINGVIIHATSDMEDIVELLNNQ